MIIYLYNKNGRLWQFFDREFARCTFEIRKNWVKKKVRVLSGLMDQKVLIRYERQWWDAYENNKVAFGNKTIRRPTKLN